MSIKSTNINFTTLPTPPSGFAYIGTDEDGKLCLKQDTGDVVYPSGVDKLSQMTDVSVSGMDIGQALVWNGTMWVNSDVIPIMDDYYTSGQTNTAISVAISNESSVRQTVESSLSQAIIDISGFDPSGILNSISTEVSNRTSGDNSLTTVILNEISTRTSADSSLSTSILQHSGITYNDSSLSTSLSNVKIETNSLSSQVSSEISRSTSLTTQISSEISTRTSADTSLSSQVSSEISTRTSADTSLSSQVSSEISRSTSLTTQISNEISYRLSGDSSLSSKIDSKVDITGGTINGNLTIKGDLLVSGTTTELNVEELLVEDNYLILNYGEPGSGITRTTSGIQIDRGYLTDYFFEFDENSQDFRIGESGDTQSVATREDTPLHSGIAVWDSATNKFITQLIPDSLTGTTTSLSTAIQSEISTRTSVDASLLTNISNEISDRVSGDNSLQTLISNETSNRISGDTSLLTIINNIPIYNDSGITQSLSTEISDRISGDSSLTTIISTEISNRVGGDSSLATQISNIPIFNPSGITQSLSTEISQRESADLILSTSISTESSNRISEDASLNTLISNETSTRSSSDLILSTSISTEISDRISGDVSLTTIISTEISNRISGDTSLSTLISNESSTRSSVDLILSTSISTLVYQTIVSITGNTTIDASYSGKICECSGTCTITFPSGQTTGMWIDFVNISTGTITFASTGTLQSSGTKLATQYTGATAYHRGSNFWIAVGLLTT